MTDDTHDMDLRAVFVDGVASVLPSMASATSSPPWLVPALRAVELRRVDTHQDGADGGLARRLADTVGAGPRSGQALAKIIDPFPNRLVAGVAAVARARVL